MGASLRASLTITPARAVRPEEFRARCEIVSEGDVAGDINLAPLSSPSLALEIVDERGQPVRLPPPPVPRPETPVARLAPGDSRVAEFSGFLPGWTPPGRYRARCRYIPGRGQGRWLEDNLTSTWVAFELAESAGPG